MEQTLLMNQSGLQSLDSQIGVQAGDTFIIDDFCLDALAEINKGLDQEDRETCLFRLQLHSYGIVTKHLPSVLMFLDAEQNELLDDKEEIFFTVLGLLARLTQPLDVLISDFPGQPGNKHAYAQGVERITRLGVLTKKLHAMIREVKVLFLTTTVVKVIVERISECLKQGKLAEPLCSGLNSFFFLLRNLLYLPDQNDKDSPGEMYGQSEELVRLLIQVDFQKLILYCTNSPQREMFALSLVQLVAAVFNKSENCPVDPGVNSKSMAIISETEEYVSPEEEEQSEALQEFAKNLIEQGGPNMLFHVKSVLLGPNVKNLSPLYYLWLLDFCLNRAVHLRLPFSTVRLLMSAYSLDYLVYLGVASVERMFVQKERGGNFSQSALHLSLVIRGMSNFFTVLNFYWESDLTQEEKQYLFDIQCLLSQSRELRQSILLLLRCHQPQVHSVHLVATLVSLNHAFLTMAERVIDQDPGLSFFDMGEHVKSYATQQVLQQYTNLLQAPGWSSGRRNRGAGDAGPCSLRVIEEVFVMLHHMAIDLGRKDLLLQMPLLQAMSSLESSPKCHQLSAGTVQLMRFALEEFYNGLECDQGAFLKAMGPAPSPPALRGLMHCGLSTSSETARRSEGGKIVATQWSSSELEQLQDICVQCEEEEQFVEAVVRQMHNLGIEKDKADIIDQLSQLDWDTDDDTVEDQQVVPKDSQEDIDQLVQKLVAMGYQEEVSWLQEVLLEIVYIKLGGLTLGRPAVEEPVIMHYIAQNLDVPLVPYTEAQETCLLQPDFTQLVTALDLQFSASPDYIFPRIPISWEVEKLLRTAENILPLNFEKTKFTQEDVRLYCSKNDREGVTSTTATPMVTDSPGIPSSHSAGDIWMLYVKSASRSPKNTNRGGKKEAWWKQ